MRKIAKKALLLTALSVFFLPATAAAADMGTGVVDADSLRVRVEPSTDASTITYLTDGTQVQVLAVLDGWYQVSYGDYTGYVSAEYLIFTPPMTARPRRRKLSRKPSPRCPTAPGRTTAAPLLTATAAM